MRTTAAETKRNDERIIDAAIRIFSEKGFEAASMQDIADAAQISRGPLYYRYKTKKDIFLAAMEVHYTREKEVLSQILWQTKPFSEIIRDYLYNAFRNLLSDKPDFPMEIFSNPEMEDVNVRIRQCYAEAYGMVQDALIHAVAAGSLRDDTDVEHLTNLIFIAFDGLRYSRLKTGILTSPDKVEAAIDHMCMLVQSRYSNP